MGTCMLHRIGRVDAQVTARRTMFAFMRKPVMVTAETALPGRDEEIQIQDKHYITGNSIKGPYPDGIETIIFGTGCFWGTEKGFWRMPGVFSTAVGYTAGFTRNATYEEVCSGQTGHTEVVQVAYDPTIVSCADLLRQFWQSHDPTQGMGQGNDRGTQYRSGIYFKSDAQKALADASLTAYQQKLAPFSSEKITTEVLPASVLYFAEDYHQQYLAKPGSRPYCSAQPTGQQLDGTSWIPADLLEEHGPKLPQVYWDKHGPRPGCTIGFDNAQVSISSL